MVALNQRLSVTHNGHNAWKLHIAHVQLNDSGTYMCQVNTDPMRSQVSQGTLATANRTTCRGYRDCECVCVCDVLFDGGGGGGVFVSAVRPPGRRRFAGHPQRARHARRCLAGGGPD